MGEDVTECIEYIDVEDDDTSESGEELHEVKEYGLAWDESDQED